MLSGGNENELPLNPPCITTTHWLKIPTSKSSAHVPCVVEVYGKEVASPVVTKVSCVSISEAFFEQVAQSGGHLKETHCPVLQLACTKGSGMNDMRSTMLLE